MGTEVCRGSVFRFGLFEADPARNSLTRNGAAVKIHDQPFRVLVFLLEHAGVVVSRDDLRQLLWGKETFVDFDANLNVILKKLRAALRDDSENPRFVETVPRHGYRFIAPVTIADSDSNRVAAPSNGGIRSTELHNRIIDRVEPGFRRRSWPGVVQFAVVVALVTAIVLLLNWKRSVPASVPVVRSNILAPQNSTFVSTSLALSQDGRMLAFVANVSSGGPASLWVETMNSGVAHSLTGTEGATLPFWSPNGQHIGYFAHGKLWRVDREGGPPQPLCDAPLGRGGTWSQDGVILFAPDINGPLKEISSSGGAPKPVLPFDAHSETVHAWWPQFLPDGKHFIYWSHTNTNTEVDGIYLAALGSNERQLLVATEANGLYANGSLLYLHDQTLLARHFDLSRLSLDVGPKTLAAGVGIQGGMHFADFAASQNGLLAYFEGRENRGWPMAVYERSGKPEGPISSRRDIYLGPRYSPNGKRLAVAIARSDTTVDDLWVMDVQRDTRTRITFGSGDSTHPVWSADGQTIFYSSTIAPDRLPHIYARLSNGAGDERPFLVTAGITEVPMDVSKDGRYLAFARLENKKYWQVWMLPLLENSKPFAFVQLPRSNATDPAFSPDGHRVAYATDETGNFEVYVSPFAGGGKWQVSTAGGTDPVWAPDGKRLYYLDGAQNVMYVDVRSRGNSVELSKPITFLPNATFPMPRPIAVAPDGRLLVDGHHDESSSPATITLVTNWPTQLK